MNENRLTTVRDAEAEGVGPVEVGLEGELPDDWAWGDDAAVGLIGDTP